MSDLQEFLLEEINAEKNAKNRAYEFIYKKNLQYEFIQFELNEFVQRAKQIIINN